MKKFCFTLVLMVVALSMYAQPSGSPSAKDIGKLQWLEGTWTRTNSKAGRSGLESWQKISASEMKGIGVTLVGADTSVVEKLKLITKDGSIFYVADVTGNQGAVLFKCTEMSLNYFACENPDHDFPKKITYKLDGAVLRAVISGNGKQIEYLFERKK